MSARHTSFLLAVIPQSAPNLNNRYFHKQVSRAGGEKEDGSHHLLVTQRFAQWSPAFLGAQFLVVQGPFWYDSAVQLWLWPLRRLTSCVGELWRCLIYGAGAAPLTPHLPCSWLRWWEPPATTAPWQASRSKKVVWKGRKKIKNLKKKNNQRIIDVDSTNLFQRAVGTDPSAPSWWPGQKKHIKPLTLCLTSHSPQLSIMCIIFNICFIPTNCAEFLHTWQKVARKSGPTSMKAIT